MTQATEHNHKGKWIRRLILLGILALVSAPWIVWRIQPVRNLNLLILDKTVPVPTYREHSSLVWALNHLKVKAPEYKDHWQLDKDYIGYYPPPQGGGGGTERRLQAGDLKDKDILFITDTYGVYRQDVAEAHRLQAPDYSPRLVGGIEPQEADAIEAFAGKGGTLIGEFNTFATPTRKEVRARIEKLFGVRWKEWVGRYFDDLGHPTEVPAWAHRKWKAQTGRDWDFKGPGFIVDHEEAQILVLRCGQEVGPKLLRIFKTKDHPLTQNVESDLPFYFWFDVVEPQAGAQVLAEYHLDLTPAGQKIWQAAGLPLTFPALTILEKPSLRVYMSGDASDTDLALGPVEIAGREAFESFGDFKHYKTDQSAFFWELYLPLFTQVLEQVKPTPGSK